MKPIVSILLVFVILSCNKEIATIQITPPVTDTGNSPRGTIKCNTFPLSFENYWIYSTVHYKADGSIDVADTDSIRIQKTGLYNGKTYAYFNPFYIRNIDCTTIGVYDPVTNFEFQLKNNSTANDTLVANIPYSSSPCRNGIKLFLNKDRTIINGHNCYKIYYELIACSGKPNSKTNIYISEGIGFVKLEEYRYNSGTFYLMTKQELTSYSIAP